MVAQQKYVTPEEYLKFERQSEVKHEYFDGEIFAMSGASRKHDRIKVSTSNRLFNQLEGRPCEVFSSDMRVRTYSTVHYTYPDVSIVCGEAKFEDDEVDTLLNPTLLIEVLSPSTENYDRGKKFQHYLTLPSLQEYLLISQDSIRVEHYIRQQNQWIYTNVTSIDAVITLPSINCTLALADVYDKVNFGEDQT